MSVEFWFSICLSFIGIALSFFVYITKKEKTGAIIATVISFIIAITFLIIGFKKLNEKKNPEVFSNQLQTTISLNESLNSGDNSFLDSNVMFSNYFATYSSKNIYSYLRVWDSEKDKDIQGNFHKYESGLKLYNSRYFYMNDSTLTSDIHLVYNPNYNGNTNFSGKIILCDSSSGTSASADISILIDGVEVWKSDSRLTGTTITPIEYSIDLKNCKEEVIIRCTCYLPSDSNIEIGFF